MSSGPYPTKQLFQAVRVVTPVCFFVPADPGRPARDRPCHRSFLGASLTDLPPAEGWPSPLGCLVKCFWLGCLSMCFCTKLVKICKETVKLARAELPLWGAGRKGCGKLALKGVGVVGLQGPPALLGQPFSPFLPCSTCGCSLALVEGVPGGLVPPSEQVQPFDCSSSPAIGGGALTANLL